MRSGFFHRSYVGLGLAYTLGLAACGGGGDGGTGPAAIVATVSVALSNSSITVGQTSQATATLRDADDNVLTGRAVTWTSSNNGVATVNSSGVVTGVAAGTANIIATSEGKTGQATITVGSVSGPVTINGLTILQNGQPANLAAVTGTITLDADLDLPAGFAGTVVVKVDTVEFVRQPIFASALTASAPAGGAAALTTITTHFTSPIETTRSTEMVSSDAIESMPWLKNGNHTGTLQVVPAGSQTPTASQSFQFSSLNPPKLRALFVVDGQSVQGSDGNTYRGGSTTIYPVFTSFADEVINSISVVLTPRQPEYRTTSPGGAVNAIHRIVRPDLDKFTVAPQEFTTEQADLTWVVDEVTINGQVFDPQLGALGVNGYITDVIGSGFANTAEQVEGLPLPPGLNFLEVDQLDPSLVMGESVKRAGIDTENYDTWGPWQLPGSTEPVFSLLDRQTMVGGPAQYSNGSWGVSQNQISADYNLLDGYRVDQLTDVSGIDDTRREVYLAPAVEFDNLFNLQYRVDLSTHQWTETNGAREYVAGIREYDKLGNWSDFRLQTTLKNGWNVAGTFTTTRDNAAFGYNATTPTLDVTGLGRTFVYNKPTLSASLRWDWSATGSPVGFDDGWLAGRATLNGQAFFGAGPNHDQYEVMASTGGASSGTASLTYQEMTDRAFQATGQRHGVYEMWVKGADRSGRFVDPGSMYSSWYRGLWDPTPPQMPNLTIQGTAVPGQPATGTISATDDIAVRVLWVGVGFDLPSSFFATNFAYVMLTGIDVPSKLGGTLHPAFSTDLTGILPIALFFFDPFSGFIDTTPFRLNSVVLQTEDLARSLSALRVVPIANTAAIVTPPTTLDPRANMSATTLCRGTGCGGNVPNLVDLMFDYFTTTATGPGEISKVEFFALPFADRNVYLLDKITDFTEAPSGNGRRITFAHQFDMRKYCGPAGPTLYFALAYAVTGLWLLKINPFFSGIIQEPPVDDSKCSRPRFLGTGGPFVVDAEEQALLTPTLPFLRATGMKPAPRR